MKFIVLCLLTALLGHGQHRLFSSEEADTYSRWVLPSDHPLQDVLPGLFCSPHMFDSVEALELCGFTMKWQPGDVRSNTILVAGHPQLHGYFIKKHKNSVPRNSQLNNYLRRIQCAERIADYIEEMQLQYIVVPKKWLFLLPDAFDDPETGRPDYLLIVEAMPILPGGWWGGETLERYHTMTREVLTEFCLILHDLGGCDAWPQNQPFTSDGKIAFIDTERLGGSKDNYLKRTFKYIDKELINFAKELCNDLDEGRYPQGYQRRTN